MPDSRLKVEDIFKEDNMLLLNSNLPLQDATRIEGSYFMPCIRRVESRFFGYVYRCVLDEEVPYLFENGISPLMCDIESGEYPLFRIKVPGKTYGYALTDLSTLENLRSAPCLVTYICFYQAFSSCYVMPELVSVCLMDIRELGGIARREPRSGDTIRGTIHVFSHHDMNDYASYTTSSGIFDVLIMYPVSKSRIVGVIKNFPESDGLLDSQGFKLYVNPEYAGGMEGARAVAAILNGESG